MVSLIKDDIVDLLVYSTAKICCTNENNSSFGTGFFMIYEGKQDILAFVTNKHVVDGYDNASINMVEHDGKGNPIDTNHINIKVSNLQQKCLYHPDSDVDICFIFINAELGELESQGRKPYYRCIGHEMLLRDEDFESLTAVEDIIMIGYPNGIMDEFNCKPVVRKGITATSLKLDYDGKAVFLIDAACFPGSSGSPVFLRKTGIAKEVAEDKLFLGVKPGYSLLGILYAGPTLMVDGKIVAKDIPTALVPVAEFQTMLNLGYVVKIREAIELFKILDEDIIRKS